MTSTCTSTGVSPSLNAATVFLTRPLSLLGLSTSSLKNLQLFLQSSLMTTSALITPNDPSAATHRLHLSPFESAPLPIHLACSAAGVAWEDWIRVLGGSSFTLIIKSTVVYVVRDDNGKVGVVWTIDPQDVAPVASALPKDFLSTRRFTNDLVDEDEDVISPIDTDSRPSSRASSYSNLSLKSSSSGTSVSSLASSVGSFGSIGKKTLAPTPAAAPKPTAAPSASPAVVSAPTKYIYQGGISTVLTGGVMLGSAKPKSSKSQATAAPSQQLSSTSRLNAKAAVYTPPHQRSHSQASSVEAIGSWRRGTSA